MSVQYKGFFTLSRAVRLILMMGTVWYMPTLYRLYCNFTQLKELSLSTDLN